MGWPRKNEQLRIYRDKDKKTFFMIDTDAFPGTHGPEYSAVANVYNGPEPSLASTGISRHYIEHNWLKRIQWDELPKQWQKAFRTWLDSVNPKNIRGFWRI